MNNKKRQNIEYGNGRISRFAHGAIEYWIQFFQYSRIDKFASWANFMSSPLFTFHFPLVTRPRAFTLVETLVAIAILLVAVVGPISLIGNALHNLYYAKDEMIAIHLAQEGIEVVRQVRDSNMLNGAIAWDTGIASGNYIIDAKSDMPVSIYGGGPLPQTVYTDAMGLYNQSAGTATQFKRIVTTSNVDIGLQMKVMSTVTWKTGGHEGFITATDYLFRWAL